MQLLKSNIDALVAAFLGMLLVLLLTQHSGLGISPDSIYYMSAADSFLAGKGFYQFDDQPFVMFPVFYPFTLSIIKGIAGGAFISVAPYLNAVLFGTSIFLSGRILEKAGMEKRIKWTLLLVIATSASLLEVYTMLWSETLFITEILVFVWVSEKYLSIPNTKHLWVMALVAAIAAATRLAGVSVIATGGLLVLLNPRVNWGNKLKQVFVYGGIAISLFAINLLRNAQLSQTLTGNRQKGVTPFVENLHYYGAVLSDWLPFSNGLNRMATWLGLAFILSLAILFIYRVWNKTTMHSFEKIVAAFTLMYSLFMLTVATISRFETLNNRLLSPFYITFILTLGFYFADCFKWIGNGIGKRILGITAFCIALSMFSENTKVNLSTYQENKEGGIGGYSDDDWLISSGLLNYLVANPAFFKTPHPIYSNAAHAVYFRTGQHLQILPERKYPDLVKSFNEKPSQILIWFNEEDNAEVLTLEEVAAVKNLQILSKFNDGVVYLCTSK